MNEQCFGHHIKNIFLNIILFEFCSAGKKMCDLGYFFANLPWLKVSVTTLNPR